MEQVSSFLETILTVENAGMGDKPPATNKDTPGSNYAKKPQSILIDKLIESLISMIIPIHNEQRIINDRIKMQKTRPPLSMQTMTNNAIMMNSRLTNTFVFFDTVVNVINWQNPYLTIGVMMVLTHLVLNPVLLMVLPMFLVVNNVLVPHYMAVHTPDRSVMPRNPEPEIGNPLREAVVPGPVPQFSQEFLLNFTDLQNHMILYIASYDFIIWLTNDYLFFKNEDLSCLVFLGLLTAIGVNLLMLPVAFDLTLRYFGVLKVLMLMVVWGSGTLAHPRYRDSVLNAMFNEDTRLWWLQKISTVENTLMEKMLYKEPPLEVPEKPSDGKLVEVYELQKFNSVSKSWEMIGFTSDFYSINHPLRKLNSNLFKDLELEEGVVEAEDNIRITRSFTISGIKPPILHEFVSEWWIDLNPKEWVESNLISDLVSVDDDEKWVYDFYEEESEVFRRRRWVRWVKREDQRK